jgi:hypothetical protein
VAFEIAADSVHGCQGPASTLTSTFEIPRSGAHATPAIVTGPEATVAFERGTSIRDWVRIGPSFAHPSGTQ